jgi:phage terminase large subunit
LSLTEEEKMRLLSGNWLVSLDGMQLCDPIKLNEIFDNYPSKEERPDRCITVDAARFGRDFCVIMVWMGWEVVFMVVMKLSDAFDIKREIEKLRKTWNVSRDNVIVDQGWCW